MIFFVAVIEFLQKNLKPDTEMSLGSICNRGECSHPWKLAKKERVRESMICGHD